jgi:hypothetical protein
MKVFLLKLFVGCCILTILGFATTEFKGPDAQFHGKWIGEEFGLDITEQGMIVLLKNDNFNQSKLETDNFQFLDQAFVNESNLFEGWTVSCYNATIRHMNNSDTKEDAAEYRVYKMKLVKPDKMNVYVSKIYYSIDDKKVKHFVPVHLKRKFESENKNYIRKFTLRRLKE